MGLFKFISNALYQSNHGKIARLNRDSIREFKNVLKENNIDWDDFSTWGTTADSYLAYAIEGSTFKFSEIVDINERSYKRDDDYQWMVHAYFNFHELKELLSFNHLFNERYLLKKEIYRLTEAYNRHGFTEEILQNIQKEYDDMTGTLYEMVNPISRKVRDTQNIEEALIERTSNSLKRAKESNLSAIQENNYQLQTLRQLDDVINDSLVSKENKEKAIYTKSLILASLKEDEEKSAKDRANMNAEIIIEASQLFHFNEEKGVVAK